jgi:hypothetical protein
MSNSAFEADSGKYRGYLKSEKYCLCIGAGVSKGVVPDWEEVTKLVVAKSFDLDPDRFDFATLKERQGWTLDSWIQTALNHHTQAGKDEDEFYSILEEALYSDLLEDAGRASLGSTMRKALSRPYGIKRDEIEPLCSFLESEYGDSSVVRLAKVLVEIIEDGRNPEAILNFNAEPLLQTFYKLFHLRKTYRETGEHISPSRTFVRILRPHRQPRYGIPIYHLHGLILPPHKWGHDSLDRLVFPETSYAQMSGSIFNWAQNTFIHYAQKCRMAFIGLSMSDSNIRRWMSWTTASLNESIREVQGEDKHLMRNVWFEKKPPSLGQKKVLEDSMWHLGTKICWVDDWPQLPRAVRNLLAL